MKDRGTPFATLRAAVKRRVAATVQQTPVRSLLTRTYAIALFCSIVALGGAIGLVIYFFLQFSSAAQLAIHVEGAWYRTLPATQPASYRFQHHHFTLDAPPDLARVAPDVVRAIASHPFFVARIVTAEGRVLAASPGADTLPAVDAVNLQAPVDSHHPLRTTFVELRGKVWSVLCLPVVSHEKTVAVVQAAVDWRPQLDLVRRLAGYLTVGALIALLLGLRIGSILSHHLVTPLERLAETTGRLANGELDARTGLPAGKNEVMAVAASFDSMAERLQSAFDSQRRFVADASHELKTPLTAIGGMVDLLEVGADDSAERRQTIVETMSHEVHRMNALILDLLLLSRAEQQSQPTEAVDVAQLVRELIDDTRMVATSHRLWSDVKGPLWVVGDANDLQRAVRNLLDNGVKFSSAGSIVRVDAHRASSGQVVIEVTDTGIGISPGDLPHVFERFYRTDRSRARSTGGCGLGLAIVKAIVERHGGEVVLESEPQKGTTVRIHLPSADGR